MKTCRRRGIVPGAGLMAALLLSTPFLLFGCRMDERLGRAGLEVAITIPDDAWSALRTAKGVRSYRENPHVFLIRFGSGRELRAGYTIRGETSLRRAFQTKQPQRLNYSVELPQSVPFAPGVRLDRLYLMNMIFDPAVFEMRFCYTLLDELGLFPAYNQLVHVTVNGDPVGLNLLLERPKDALLRSRPDIASIHRRSYDEEGRRGAWEPVFRRRPGAGSGHVERLRAAVSRLRGKELVAELDAILDLDSYMRWLAFNSLVRNADSYDEIFFYLAHSPSHPEGRLEIMAWDYDDVMRPAPAHPRLALDDPLLFAAEAPLDRRIKEDPVLYGRFQRVLEELLETRLTQDRLASALEEARAEVEAIDLPIPADARTAFSERRQAALEEFGSSLLARREELLRQVAESTAPDRTSRARTRRVGREAQEAPDVLWRDLRPDPAALTTGSDLRFELTAPRTLPPSGRLPVVVRAVDAAGRVDRSVSGWVLVELTGNDSRSTVELLLRRGVGSAEVVPSEPKESIALGVAGLGPSQVIATVQTETRRLSGRLDGEDLHWRSGDVVDLTGEVTVPADETLVVEAGVVVQLGPRANLLVEGDLESRGEPKEPIVFQPRDAGSPWGGIVHSGRATYRWTFLTGGGGDPRLKYGHSRSQAMLFGRQGSRIDLENAFLLDAPGKGIGGLGTELELRDSLVSRTDMGGELINSRVEIERSWFLDFPDLGAPFRDDDNDALYLKGRFQPAGDRERQTEPSRIIDSVFIGGIDDGIDHNGAMVEIRSSWIQGFSHEGIAASVSGRLLVEDTVVAGCEQGIEAGVGSPIVEAAHVLVFGNDVGVRYGDAYGGRYGGTIQVTDSVVVGNRGHALRNWLHRTQGPAPRGIGLHRSLVDVRSWDHGEGNAVGSAVLTDELLLAPGSPGRGIARGGADPGLVTPRPAGPPG